MTKDTSKRQKIKRPPKPPLTPMRPDQEPIFGIGLIQEKLIGRVLVEWTRVEAALNDIIWHLTGLSFEDGRVLTGRSDAATRISTLQVLAPRYLDGDLLTTLEVVLAAADTLRDDRNFIVHGSWGTLLPENVAIALSLRAKSKPGEVMSESFSHERMRDIIKRIIWVRSKLVQVLDKLEASPETPA